MIILKHVKFISNGRIFRSGEVVPDNAVTRLLVENGQAEIINPSSKTTKKPKAETPRENVESDS